MGADRRGVGTSALVAIILTTAALLVAGCTSHYRYGRQTRAYFTAQRVNPQGATGSPAGLDSEEASLIHASYRRGMAPEGYNEDQSDQNARVLVISDDNAAPGREATRGRSR